MRAFHLSRPILSAAFPFLASTLCHAQPFANASESRAGYSGGDIAPQGECAALTGIRLPDLVEITARAVPAEPDAPAHCRVSGTLAPEIGFEVNLPDSWNGRFYMIGNGGHAGQQPDAPDRAAQRAEALRLGFAMASTNTGHDARTEPQATFVLSNPQKAIDYAYRAVHLTAVAAKTLAEAYYGEPPAHSYWNSCSNGGRQGLIEAQRYPEDFDGIVANAPWVDQTGFTIGAIWNQRALDEAPLSAEKLALVADRVMAQCDAVDGLRDGLIDDPRKCSFEVARDVPICPSGTDSDACLTEAQARAVQKIYDGPSTSDGRSIFPGFMPGSEAIVEGRDGVPRSNWMGLIVPGAPDAKAADFSLAEATMRYLVFDPPQPDWDYRTFDFDQDTALLERWGRIANATQTDLGAFRERGGKLIITYGWADTILQPMMGVEYYERAAEANGENSDDFMRLFMVPGMAHCGGGVGPDQMDPVTAVIDWVEEGSAPDKLVAKKVVDGATVRSRPLCPYPQVARYKGEGSPDDAASFECRDP
ncbi:MAG TPA: tannase/feruloyl esterase family alpha/beta hydrolase [Gammaproteobacteria bacterium]